MKFGDTGVIMRTMKSGTVSASQATHPKLASSSLSSSSSSSTPAVPNAGCDFSAQRKRAYKIQPQDSHQLSAGATAGLGDATHALRLRHKKCVSRD
ncbi:hypothetical protein BaRGS_00024061 [Batillaria attramentaria]|uniref:Uncharacterized protein n=1 Tax=Batillaria attramentaria TaxID=370345 RepID=A0ABD0KC31_9CAEN